MKKSGLVFMTIILSSPLLANPYAEFPPPLGLAVKAIATKDADALETICEGCSQAIIDSNRQEEARALKEKDAERMGRQYKFHER